MREPEAALHIDHAQACSFDRDPALTHRPPRTYSILHWNDGTKMGKEAGKHHHPARSRPRLPHSRQFDDASAMFRALGEPSRLRLLTRLIDRRDLRIGTGGVGRREAEHHLRSPAKPPCRRARQTAPGSEAHLLCAFRYPCAATGSKRFGTRVRKGMIAGATEEKDETQ